MSLTFKPFEDSAGQLSERFEWIWPIIRHLPNEIVLPIDYIEEEFRDIYENNYDGITIRVLVHCHVIITMEIEFIELGSSKILNDLYALESGGLEYIFKECLEEIEKRYANPFISHNKIRNFPLLQILEAIFIDDRLGDFTDKKYSWKGYVLSINEYEVRDHFTVHYNNEEIYRSTKPERPYFYPDFKMKLIEFYNMMIDGSAPKAAYEGYTYVNTKKAI